MVVGIAATGVVGDIHYFVNLGHRVKDRNLDPLGHRGRSHSATLATAAHAQVRDGSVDRDELGETTV